jgi:hypothetical protein
MNPERFTAALGRVRALPPSLLELAKPQRLYDADEILRQRFEPSIHVPRPSVRILIARVGGVMGERGP